MKLVLPLVFACTLACTSFGGEPLPNIDKRAERAAAWADANRPARVAARERTRENLQRTVPGVEMAESEWTEGPRSVASNRSFLSGIQGEGKGISPAAAAAIPKNDPQRPIKAFLNEHRNLFGHGSEALAQAVLARDDRTRRSGLRTFVWQQQVDGIPLYRALLKACVTAKGELVQIGSGFIADPVAAADRGVPRRARQQRTPEIGVKQALHLAVADIGEAVVVDAIHETDAPEPLTLKQHFQAPDLVDPHGQLTWLPLGETAMRLCWDLIFMSNQRNEMYRTLVDAETGEVLIRRCLTESISDASYRVYTSDSPSPNSPGLSTPGTAQPDVIPRTLVTTSALDTIASPNGWIDDGVNETRGNNVDAHLDLNADNNADTPRPQGSPTRVFDFTLDLTQNPSAYRSAAVTNLFYWCNIAHDRYYQLGFTESAGNFQGNNFGRGGLGNDAVMADAQDGSGTSNANFSTPPDGAAGRMQMYVFTGPTPDRDGDLDSEIIIHEYTHGLSTRLVGGGVGIESRQTSGMGEGWSDFYALSLLSEPGDDVDANYAFGAYASNQYSSGFAQNYYFGIRRYPYSTDLTKNPLTFRDIDPSQRSTHLGVPSSPAIGTSATEVHNLGEVWCVTLWEARALLIKKLGHETGNTLMMQLVTDGMKLSPAEPTYLQARDAILQADMVLTAGANRQELWTAFAKRGMGAYATSPESNTTAGLVENFDLPDDLSLPTASVLSFGTPTGPFAPSSHPFSVANTGINPISWSVVNNQPWLDLDSAGGTLAPGEGATVNATLNTAADSFPPGTYTATLTFTNTTSGTAQKRTFQLLVQPFGTALFTETFESGSLNPTYWSKSGKSTWRTQVTTAGSPHGGSYQLTMDSSVATSASRNEATLTLNLNGQTGLTLTFWAKMFSDDPNGPPGSPFFQHANFDGVAISANGTDYWEIQPLRSPSITNDWGFYSIDLDAAIAAHGISYNSTFRIRFNQYDDNAIPYAGIAIDDIFVGKVYQNKLVLSLPSSATEGIGDVPGSITATIAPAVNTTISLSSSDPASLAVPPSVVMLAGEKTATFLAIILDDTRINGTRSPTVTAQAVTWMPATTQVTIADNESKTLSLILPASVREGDTGLTGQCTIPGTLPTNLVIALSSSDTTEITLPVSATILAGQTSVTFAINVVDDVITDGAQAVTLSAAASAFTGTTSPVTVLDNDVASYSIGAITGAQPVDAPIPITVTALDINGLVITNFTGYVAITGAGSAGGIAISPSVLSGFANGVWSGSVILAAPASQVVLSVTDNTSHTGASNPFDATVGPLDHFTFAPIGASQVSDTAFTITISACDINGAEIASFNAPVALSAANSSGVIAITPTSAIDWQNGIWTGQVTLGATGEGVTISATDGAAHSGTSSTFSVVLPPTLSITSADGFLASGPSGGAFTPASHAWTLSNAGSGTLDWTASNTAAWLSLSPVSGTLAAGDTVIVTASLTSAVQNLASGGYSDTVTFTNATNQIGTDSRAVALTVTAAIDGDHDGLPDLWETQYGLDIHDATDVNGALGDPDGDGYCNALEYLLGLNPVAPDRNVLRAPVIVQDSGTQLPYLTWQYNRRIEIGAIQCTAEVSDDLVTWYSDAEHIEQLDAPVVDPDGITEVITVRALPSIGPSTTRRYFRLKMTLPGQ